MRWWAVRGPPRERRDPGPAGCGRRLPHGLSRLCLGVIVPARTARRGPTRIRLEVSPKSLTEGTPHPNTYFGGTYSAPLQREVKKIGCSPRDASLGGSWVGGASPGGTWTWDVVAGGQAAAGRSGSWIPLEP